MRPIVAAVIMLLALAGCGEGGEPAGSPEDTARRYVASLNHKDGTRFCSLVAPYIAGEFDLGAHELWGREEEKVEKKLKVDGGCALFVTAYTGYIDDPGEQWTRADVLSAGPARREGKLMAVPLRLRHHYVDTNENTRSEKEEDEVVYLARFDGRWHVARLSVVAHHASLATSGDSTGATGPPDVKAEQARYDALKAKTGDREARERDAYAQPSGKVGCEGREGRITDPAGDLEDQGQGNRNPHPDAPEADLRSATIVPTTDRFCVTVELGSAPSGELALSLRVRNHSAPGSDDGTPEFLATVTAERRDDGKWRVSSGKNDDGHPRLIPGAVSEDGARVSFAVERSDVQYADQLPPTGDFAWSVDSLAPRLDQDSVFADSAPDGYGVVYPSNRNCGVSTHGGCSTG
jgi:hypothetical protein